jgi:hypothetical protein
MRRHFAIRTTALVCLLATVPFATGCGVIFGGTRQTIRATSSPEGASVETTPASIGYKTPTTLNLERKNSYVLTFSMPGYTSQKAELQRSLRTGIVIADVLLTGLVGIVIDAVTGAWYKLSPDVANVTLTRTGASLIGPETIVVSIGVDSSEARENANVQLRSTEPGVNVEVSTK